MSTSESNLEPRHINPPTIVNPMVKYNRIWTFRTQEIMDLFINEMQPQISDGAWENSRDTEWLYAGQDIFMLGDATSLHYAGPSYTRKHIYYALSQVLPHVEDRIYTENGFEFGDKKSLSAAWKELLAAIKNYESFTAEENEKYVTEPSKRIAAAKETAMNEMDAMIDQSKYIADSGKRGHCRRSYFYFENSELAGGKPARIKINGYTRNYELKLAIEVGDNEITLNAVHPAEADAKIEAAIAFLANI